MKQGLDFCILLLYFGRRGEMMASTRLLVLSFSQFTYCVITPRSEGRMKTFFATRSASCISGLKPAFSAYRCSPDNLTHIVDIRLKQEISLGTLAVCLS
jgi:hypothetical protein